MRRLATPLLALLALALLVWLGESLLNAHHRSVAGFAGIYIVLAVSLSFANGLTGLFSLGHPAFMLLGGYVAALLTLPASRKASMLPDLPTWLAAEQWPLLPATLAGGAAAVVVALLAGFPVLRLRGHYLAVATLGLIIIVRGLINNSDGLTRGALGLNGIPRLADLWWIYGWVAVTFLVCWRLKHSSVGRSLLALRENEMAAACMGVLRSRARLAAFTLGAFFAGVGGALWAHLLTNLTPGSFGIPLAFTLVVMVVIGGSGSLTGAALAAVALTVLGEALRPLEQAVGAYGLVQIVVALLLIVTLLMRPQGLFGSLEPAFVRTGAAALRRRRPAAGSAAIQVEEREVLR